MANNENLVSLADRTTDEKREIAKKGGKASGEARRRRKSLKEDLLVALEIVKGDKTIQEIGVEAILKKYMDGEIQAFTTIRDTIGEKPIDKVEQEITNSIRVDLTDE